MALDERVQERSKDDWSASGHLGRSPLWPAIVVFVLVLGVYGRSGVSLTRNDPTFSVLAAHSLVHERNLDLNEWPDEMLIEHLLVVETSEGTSVGIFPSADDVARERAASGTYTYDYFPWVAASFAIPAIIVTDLQAAVIGGLDSKDRLLEGTFDGRHLWSASVVVALAAVMAFLVAREVLRRGEATSTRRDDLVAAAAALVFAFGTSAWSTASRALWQHTPSLLFVLVALYFALRIESGRVRGRTHPELRLTVGAAMAAQGVALAAAVVARPTNLWLALGLAVAMWWRHRRWARPLIVGAATTAACFAVLNLVLIGSAVPPYYSGSRVTLHSEFGEALAAQWLSPSRGLLWASPVVLVAIPGAVLWWRRRDSRPMVVALVASVIGVTFSSSAFAHWWAGHSYGPRFMTEALPSLFVLALPAVTWALEPSTERRGLRMTASALGLVLVMASVGFHGIGATTPSVWCWNVEPVNIDEDHRRIWSLGDSQPAAAVDVVRNRSFGRGC